MTTEKSIQLRLLVETGNLADLEKLPDVWIFGYGSLVWLPKFEFSEKKIGKILGWKRRFYQGNSTHRGIPGKPGRVVTLLPSHRSDSVYGCAYRLTGADQIKKSLDHLNMRESTLGGYELNVETFQCEETGRDIPVLVYRATSSNPQFTGFEEILELAHVIAFSTGPAGSNWEYLARLAQWHAANVRATDHHLEALERATRKIMEEKVWPKLEETIRPRKGSNAIKPLQNKIRRFAE